jgi:hypothetical protein
MFDFTAEKLHSRYKDEPYDYHAHLIELIAMTTIGKEGMYFSENKVRQTLHLKYVFELLSIPDSLT